MLKFVISAATLGLLVACTSTTKLHSQKNIEQATGQDIGDKQKITQTIETYFEGWMTGDTTKLGAAMHRTCQLKNIKDDDVIIFDRSTYLGFFKPRPRRKNAGGEIIDIDITDQTASAKCEIHTEERLYTDYFNMMKLKDRWYIVDKIASSKLIDTK